MDSLPVRVDAADRECKNLKPTDKDQYIKDGVVPGLVLRVTPTGKKIWQFRYSAKVEGVWKDRKTSIGSFDAGMTTKPARLAAESLRGDRARGIDPLAEKRAKEERAAEKRRQQEQERLSRVTMQDLFETFKANKLNDHKDGGAWAGGIITDKILSKYADLEVKNFDQAVFFKIVDPMVQSGNKRSANVVLALAKQMMRFAVSRKIIAENPLKEIARKEVGGKGVERDRVLCAHEEEHTHSVVPDELVSLFKLLPVSGLSKPNQIALHLTLATVCRIGELLLAKWSDVNFEAAEWRLPGENTKNKKPHLVNLSGYALSYMHRLRELNGDSVWLFPARRSTGHVDLKSVTKSVAERQTDPDSRFKGRTKKYDALKLPRGKWTPHDLRRTGATMMAQLGAMDATIERCLNHTEANRMKRIYNRHNPRAAMKEAWGLLGEELERLAELSKEA